MKNLAMTRDNPFDDRSRYADNRMNTDNFVSYFYEMKMKERQVLYLLCKKVQIMVFKIKLIMYICRAIQPIHQEWRND
jgi:hypothetical protein